MGAITNAVGMGGKIKGFMEKRKKSGSGSGSGSVGGNSYDGDTGESFKRGGKVKRTGLAKVHAGEQVLTGKQAKRYKARGSKR